MASEASPSMPSLLRSDAVRQSVFERSWASWNKKVKCSTQKNYTCTEPDDPIGYLSRWRAILDPNSGPYWCRLHHNYHQMASAGKGFQQQKTNSNASSPSTPLNCPCRLCQGASNMGHSKGESFKLFFRRKRVTLTVQMACNVTGRTRRSHLRCFLPATVDCDLGVLFHSVEHWCFRWCRVIKRWLVMCKCWSGRPSWLRALVWVFQQDNAAVHKARLIKVYLRTFGDGWQGGFIKNDHQFQTVDVRREAFTSWSTVPQ